MKIAILSDIHGNREALDTVLSDLDSRNIKNYILVGDLVDYGADSSYVIDKLYERKDMILKSVRGNHDAAVLGQEIKFRTPKHVNCLEITKQGMKPGDYSRLIILTSIDKYHFDNLKVIHGSPDNPLKGELFSGDYLNMINSQTEISINIFGHTHLPYFNKRNGMVVLNPGSIGQPRDGDWRSSYSIIEVNTDEGYLKNNQSLFFKSYENVRLEYDCNSASKKILDSGKDRWFADRVLVGC